MCVAFVALVLLDSGLDGTTSLPDADLTTLTRHALYRSGVSSPKSFFTGQWEPGIFGEICLDSNLLVQLKVVFTQERKVTKEGFSRGRVILIRGLRAH